MINKLPTGWKIVTIDDVFDVIRGISFPKSARTEESEHYVGCLRTANVQRTIEWDDLWKVPSSYLPSKEKLVQENDIIISTANSLNLLGKSAMVKNVPMPSTFGTFVVNLRARLDDPKYLYYYLQSRMFMEQVAEQASTTTNISNISTTKLKRLLVPIPEFSEQKRIVARMEELFSELDNGVETLRKTKQQLAVYRQAVLKQAFDTKDTATVEISQIVDDIRIGPFGTMLHKSDYISDGIPVINPQHIKNNIITAGSKVTISSQKAEELTSYRLRCNDIVMGRRGEMGRCAAVTEKEHGWICGTGSIMFRLKADFDALFYAQILSSPDVVRYLEENATGTTMKNLNEEIVKHIPVPYITRQQQKTISQKIDAALSVCDSIEKTVDTALQQAEAMRQSILKKAFEGIL